MNQRVVTPGMWQRINAERWSVDRLLLHFGIERAPVPVEQLATELGVRLERVTGADWDGMVDSRESPPIISINADRSRTRQRFSIAHELGHLLLHDPGQRFRDNFSSMGLDLREIQANQFAAKLLMPSWMVNAYARVGARLTALAGLFDVSPQAMRIRLEQLGYNVT